MFACVFSPNPFSTRDLAVLAGLLQLLDALDSQLVVQDLDLLGAKPGDVEHRHQPGRGRGLQLLVIRQLAGRDQLGDLLLDSPRQCL